MCNTPLIFSYTLSLTHSHTYTAVRGVCFLRLSPPTSDLARRGRRKGAELDAEFAFHAPRRQLRAWPGWGGGGVRCLGVEFAFLSVPHWPLDGRPSYARSLFATPSKTLDQTLMRWERPAPLRCELNLLGRPCGAGWVKKENTHSH